MKYIKKEMIIEAVKFNDATDCLCELSEFGLKPIRLKYIAPDKPLLIIEGLQGEGKAEIGDYIVKGLAGDFYSLKAYEFERLYSQL